MVWNMGRYDAENLTVIRNGTYKSEEPVLAMLRGYPLGGFQECPTMASSKRSLRSYLSQQEELVSDDDVADEISPRRMEKKKRLTTEQVKSLEISFEMENKLDPERKQKLANDLGLQPRQVAIWFQNRRARWKTKRLEQDYESLKSQYDAVLLDRETLRAEVNRLTKELENKEQYRKGNAIEKQHGEVTVHKERLNLQEDVNGKKAVFQILNQHSPGFQCGTCNEKETSLYSDQTDISSPFHCDSTALHDDKTVHSEFIKMENAPSSSFHTNRYIIEQIGRKMDENILLEDQYYLGLYTTESYDVPWLWLN